MEHITLGGLRFQRVEAQSLYLGTNKGGWIYTSQRPRHEVRLPAFYIMKEPINAADFDSMLNEGASEQNDEFQVTADALKSIMKAGQSLIDSGIEGLDEHQRWEIRCPSEAEWRCAESNIGLGLDKKQVEVLADAVNSNYRGAMMDGRPRRFEGIGPMAFHRAAIETHPSKEGITALSSVPLDRPIKGVKARLVITPVREDEPQRVPESADMIANIRTEVVCIFVLGVIPSFVIPILRGMSDYAVSGWANLLFGGLCAGFVTGAFWRPRRPTVHYREE